MRNTYDEMKAKNPLLLAREEARMWKECYDALLAERNELLKTLRDVDAMADRNAGFLTRPMRLYIGDVLRALAQQKPKEEGR